MSENSDTEERGIPARGKDKMHLRQGFPPESLQDSISTQGHHFQTVHKEKCVTLLNELVGIGRPVLLDSEDVDQAVSMLYKERWDFGIA